MNNQNECSKLSSYWKILLLILLLNLIVAIQVTASNSAVPSYRISFSIDGNTVKIPYYRNFSIGANASVVEHAVIVIHGIKRNADDYYNAMLDAAFRTRNLNTSNFVMAPQFLVEDDLTTNNLGPEMLFWKSSGWPVGDMSVQSSTFPTPASISSFAVMDTVLMRLANAYPNLDTIIVAGHSAGGQYVQRYAAGNTVDSLLFNEYGIYIRYIVANPSSYVYLNGERRIGGTLDQFRLPTSEELGFCKNYNDYKYGLENLNNYMSLAGPAQIRQQYGLRNIIYLLGELDNDPNANYLDKDCEAMWQGSHRLERGTIFFNYIRYYYGVGKYNHIKATVDGVNHDYYGMFNSSCGLYFIYNYGSCGTIDQIENDQVTRYPVDFNLIQNFPNPFNPLTMIRFSLGKASQVSLTIYNIRGEKVATLINNRQLAAGSHEVEWQASAFTSGVYYCRLQTAYGHLNGLKMVLVK